MIIKVRAMHIIEINTDNYTHISLSSWHLEYLTTLMSEFEIETMRENE